MGMDNLIQYFGDAHLALLMYQQWNVVYPLSLNVNLCHSDRSITQFRFSHQK